MSDASSARERTFVIRDLPYSYLHLILTGSNTTSSSTTNNQLSIDEVSIRSYIAAAMQQYLGLTGAAIPVDILKVSGVDTFIRVPATDESAVVAAISQWSSSNRNLSIRIAARGSWLGGLVSNPAMDKKLWTLET